MKRNCLLVYTFFTLLWFLDGPVARGCLVFLDDPEVLGGDDFPSVSSGGPRDIPNEGTFSISDSNSDSLRDRSEAGAPVYIGNATPPEDELAVGVVVGGFSTGAGLPEAFSKESIASVHVNPGRGIHHPAFRESFQRSSREYLLRFIFDAARDNLDRLVKRIKEEVGDRIQFVVPGSEPAVGLSDQLTHAFHTPGNTLRLTKQRTDKMHMYRWAEKHGIKTIPFFTAGKFSKRVLSRVDKELGWPVVLKPAKSSGNQGVKLCHNPMEVEAHFAKILRDKTTSGGSTDSVVLMQYKKGTVYIVNMASWNRTGVVSGLWKCEKENLVYRRDDLLPLKGGYSSQLLKFAQRIEDVFEMHYGGGHIEILVGEDGELYLMEIGARLSGGSLPRLEREAIGMGQMEWLVMAYSRHNDFIDLVRRKPHYELEKHATTLTLWSRETGHRLSRQKLMSLKDRTKYPTILDVGSLFKDGEKLPVTVDLDTALGRVLFVDADQGRIEKDLEAVLKLEPYFFFRK